RIAQLSQKLDRRATGGKPEQRTETRRRVGEQRFAGGMDQRWAARQQLPEPAERLRMSAARQGKGCRLLSPRVVVCDAFGGDAHQAKQGSASVCVIGVLGERAGERKSETALHLGGSLDRARCSVGRGAALPGRRG